MNIKSFKPRAAGYYVTTETPGLQIRVAPDGSKTWSVRYRIGKQQRRLTLGRADAIPLADGKGPQGKVKGARTLALEALHAVRTGADPADAKRQTRDAETVGDFAKIYIEKHAKPKKRSWQHDQSMLDRDVLPAWRHKRMRDVTRRDVRNLLEQIAERAPIVANRTRSLLHKMFVIAIQHDVVEHNPVTATERPGEEQQRDRVLTHDEIRTFWAASEALPVEAAAAFRLRLLTAQRAGEVIGMQWSELDLENGWWSIPAKRAKNGLSHRVPLNGSALGIIKRLRAQADTRMATQKEPKDPVFVLEGGRGKRQLREAAQTFGLENFKGHDLRRTAASLMAAAGVQRLVVSKILNHVETGVTSVYDRHGYDNEKRAALDTWERTLTAILAKKEGDSNVVAFTGQKQVANGS